MDAEEDRDEEQTVYIPVSLIPVSIDPPPPLADEELELEVPTAEPQEVPEPEYKPAGPPQPEIPEPTPKSVPVPVISVGATARRTVLDNNRQNGRPIYTVPPILIEDDPDPPDLSKRSHSRKAKERAARQAKEFGKGRQLDDLFRKIRVMPRADDWQLARPVPVPRKFMPGHAVPKLDSPPKIKKGGKYRKDRHEEN